MDTNEEERQARGAYIPQELLEEIRKVHNRLLIGIPREREEGERRVALTPEAVSMLTDCGHRVWVESGAGLGINYSDARYAEAGAEIVATPAELFRADIILKMLPPTAEEVEWTRPRATLFSLFQLNRFSRKVLELLMAKRVTALSYELLEDSRGCPLLRDATSEIEGATAITVASELLSNERGGKGILLGSIPGVSPTEVVIVGAGRTGTAAARAALAQGALVRVFDDDIHRLEEIRLALGQSLFTSTYHPNVLRNALRSADVVIGAIRFLNIRHRYMIASDMVREMKRGALAIDLRTGLGGCFETTCCLPEGHPELFEQYGILHYCRQNISNRVARTTSMAYSNILVPLLLALGDSGSTPGMAQADEGFRRGVYLYRGKMVNSYVAGQFNLPANNLDLFLSAF